MEGMADAGAADISLGSELFRPSVCLALVSSGPGRATFWGSQKCIVWPFSFFLARLAFADFADLQ